MKQNKIQKGGQFSTSKYFSKPKSTESCLQQLDDRNGGSKRPDEELSIYTRLKLQSFACDVEHDHVPRSDEKNPLTVHSQLETNRFNEDEQDAQEPVTQLTLIDEESSANSLQEQKGQETPSFVKQSDLQQQFRSLKMRHPSVLLFIECGYKYHFFEEDAEIAAKHLNISCYTYRDFKTASIPAQTLYLHVQRLVFRDFKVGIVSQVQTTALKSIGESRNSLFERELTAIYTKSTLIGEDYTKNVSYDGEGAPSDGYLACLFEETSNIKSAKLTQIGLIAVRPVTGDVSSCSFDDGKTREKLQEFLSIIQPVEIILPENISTETRNVIEHLKNVSKEGIRIEYVSSDLFSYEKAVENMSEFCALSTSELTKLPPLVLRAISALFQYLKDFGLQKILKELTYVKPLELHADKYVRINYVTMKNLDIFGSYSSCSYKMSLFKLIDRTQTPFGRRLLKEWIQHPLKSYGDITERQNVVETVLKESEVLNPLKKLLRNHPDVEYWLCSVYYRKCSCLQLFSLLKSLNIVRSVVCDFWFVNATDEIKSIFPFLQEVVQNLSEIPKYLSYLNEDEARNGDKMSLFINVSLIPGYCELQLEIDQVLQDLKCHKTRIADLLEIKDFNYTTVNYTRYLIEVPNYKESRIPSSWRKMNMTKTTARYRSPEADKFSQKLLQLKEQKNNICQIYWIQFLDEVNTMFFTLKKVIHHLAEIDCYFSLAEFAQQDGYVKPTILPFECETILDIEGGRHPIIEKYLPDDTQFVANDLHLNSEKKCIILTGPNMGGKSTFIKQVGLIALLAQIGSYVPAKSVSLTSLDAIHIRAGSIDNLFENQSTFYVEAIETQYILQDATSKSLVLFDELGCGTSSHDGMAIAYATLHHLLNNVQCLSLFVTHYAHITDLALTSRTQLAQNTHMSFAINQSDDDERKILFLYKMSMGTSKESFGLNVAKLAAIPQLIINNASFKAGLLEDAITKRRKGRRSFMDLMKLSAVENVRQMIMDIKYDDFKNNQS